MNRLFEAAWELHQFFEKNKLRYTIIGGIALQYWGEPRLTRDVDITVLAPPQKESSLVKLLIENFASRISDPVEFALKNRVVLLTTTNGAPADISLGIYGYEEGVIKRSISVALERDKKLNICSAEDLIIHKAVAGRPLDIQDIEGIVIRQQEKLDIQLIREWLKEFSELLPEVPVEENFERSFRKLK